MSWDKELRLYSLINIASQCLFYSFCQSNKSVSVSGDIVVPQSDVRQSPGQARLSQLNVWVWSTQGERPGQ